MQNTENWTGQLTNVKIAANKLNLLSDDLIAQVLNDVANAMCLAIPELLAANARDLAKMEPSNPKYDRLLLNPDRINGIANDMRSVAKLPSPRNRLLNSDTRPNGLVIEKVSVPLGVVGVVYEARPNVTFDVFAIGLKAGNAVVLKGGSDAYQSNEAAVGLIRNILAMHNIDPYTILLTPPDRQAALDLLQAVGFIDIVIPRGSQALIDFVRENARVPVIETGAGIVHTYIHKSADLQMAQSIIINAKTRRVSVCNALDCLIVDAELLNQLPYLLTDLPNKNVQIFADESAYSALQNNYPPHLLNKASDEHFGTEFLDYKMAIKTVFSFEEALGHIAKYSSMHSEAIVATDAQIIETFLNMVDAAAVYANSSTAFTDGAQFGMGAEIGISTQKLHARGPMALPELTTYKFKVRGNGQVRA